MHKVVIGALNNASKDLPKMIVYGMIVLGEQTDNFSHHKTRAGIR